MTNISKYLVFIKFERSQLSLMNKALKGLLSIYNKRLINEKSDSIELRHF